MRQPTSPVHLSAATIALAALLIAPPVRADDDTKVTLAAGLGLTAASGKTTLGYGAGAIEAGVLGADAFDQAGAVIATLVNKKAPKAEVLVLARDEQINLAMAWLVENRITAVTRLLASAQASCSSPAT